MQDGFKIGPCGRVGKNDPGQFLAVEPAIGGKNGSAKSDGYFFQCRLPRLNQLPRNHVRVRHKSALLSENIASRGFSHSDPAGDAKELHRAAVLLGQANRAVESGRKIGADIGERKGASGR